MPPLTLHFESLHEAQEVIGPPGAWPEELEQAFGVQLLQRENWLQIAGGPEATQRAQQFIQCLRAARTQGTRLRGPGRRHALQAFLAGQIKELENMFKQRIEVSKGKQPVFPKTLGQMSYVQQIQQNDICFGMGPAGTGKTYLAMALAVTHLLEERVSRIILTRPAVEAGEALGFLPGDMNAKVLPYLRPLYDALYDMMPAELIEQHLERGVIEVAPLAYMRGRTLNHAFIILDEAQNTSPEQMVMFLTRMGFDSKCVITGDPSQIDLPPGKSSGLVEARATLRNIKGIGMSELSEGDVVRHKLVQRIIRAYRQKRQSAE